MTKKIVAVDATDFRKLAGNKFDTWSKLVGLSVSSPSYGSGEVVAIARNESDETSGIVINFGGQRRTMTLNEFQVSVGLLRLPKTLDYGQKFYPENEPDNETDQESVRRLERKNERQRKLQLDLAQGLEARKAMLELRRVNAVKQREEDIRAEINRFSQIISNRKIRSLYHFTRVGNLKNIFEHGLVPQDPEPDFRMLISDHNRYDGRLDCVSLSISFPNYKMFHHARQRYPDHLWCVVSVKPEILSEAHCLFFHTNAATFSSGTDRQSWRLASTLEGLFQGDMRPDYLPVHFPTDVQAEVQVESKIPVSMLSSINFKNEHDKKKFLSTSPIIPNHVEVVTNGGLFGYRDRL
jgi:hypothetical protein